MSDVAEVKEALDYLAEHRDVGVLMLEKGRWSVDVLADAARRWARIVDEGRFCPFCGRPRERDPGDEMCLPSNCDAWRVVSRFNHETREWEPVDV